jgi:hypothetical protein
MEFAAGICWERKSHTASPTQARYSRTVGVTLKNGSDALRPDYPSGLTYVSGAIRVTYMEKTQVYLRKEELNALRKAAARSRRSVAALVREAVRKVILMPPTEGPVAIWDGEPKRSSIEHDSVYDEP